jgi:cysteine desulfurase / selenocysteine lyase
MDIEKIRRDFPLLQNGEIAYLDSGATTQKPQQVIETVKEFYTKHNANPHRGAYSLSIEATELYEETRDKIARFINAREPEEIIFTKNATESLNLLAYSYGMENLVKDDEVVISIMEHHSNLVPWQKATKKTDSKLTYMYINEQFELTKEEIESKITDKTKIVGITHISNVLGTINPVKEIIQYAHKKGAIVIVDASQSVPHLKIDVRDLDADFLVFSGHKMLAPLGVGVLYGKKELLNKMTPFLMGGDMIEYVYEQETTFAPLPNKFEAGTQNVEGVVGLGAAIDYIENIGYDKIQAIEKELTDYAVQKLSQLDYVKLYVTPNKENHSSVISFNLNGVHPHDVASILDSNKVAIRSGNHCAQPLMRYLNTDSTCRASIYFYNTKEDIDRLIQGIEKTYKMFEKYIKK